VLASAVADELRGLPPGPVLSADYIWWAKLNTYLARERLTVRRAVDPAYLDADARERARRLEPLPDVAGGRGGYVVTGPVRETSAWPSNWAATRRAIESIPRGELEPVARVGRAMIWRWAR
jgi:hypothetical protein